MRRTYWLRTTALALLSSLLLYTATAATDPAAGAGVILGVAPGSGGTSSVTPLGLLPAEGKLITAPAGQVLDITFTDGTSVRLAAGSVIRVETYRFDTTSGTGNLRFRLVLGAVRLNGGRLGARRSILVNTPAGSITVGQSLVVISTTSGGTLTTLITGAPVTVSNENRSQTIERPGFSVATQSGEKPQTPTQQSQDDLKELALLFNPALGAGEQPGDQTGSANDNQSSETQVVSNEVQDDLSGKDASSLLPPTYRPYTDGRTGSGAGFDPTPASPANWSTTEISTSNELTRTILSQGAVPGPGSTSAPRPAGLSTARIFLSGRSLSQSLSSDNTLNPTDTVTYATYSLSNPNGTLVEPGDPIRKSGETTTNSMQYTFFNEVTVGSQGTDGQFVTQETVPVFAKYLFLGPPGADLNIDGPIRIVMSIPGQPAFVPKPTPTEFGGSSAFNDGRFGLVNIFIVNNDNRAGYGARDDFDEDKVLFQTAGFFGSVSLANTMSAGFWKRPDGFIDRENDNFFLFQTYPLTSTILDDYPRKEVFTFAAGDVDNTPASDRRLDQFFISVAANKPIGPLSTPRATIQPGVRGFLRPETAALLHGSLRDSGLLVIGSPAASTQTNSTGSAQTGALHTDFAVLRNAGTDQFGSSTISTTIGEIRYDTNLDYRSLPVGFTDTVTDLVQGLREEVGFRAHTIGSTLTDTGAPRIATTDVFNTAAGGGNPWDAGTRTSDGDFLYEQLPGRVGYIVLENYVPSLENAPGNGGVEHVLGSTNTDQSFAVLRLAQGASSTAIAASTSLDLDAKGFAGALEFTENGTDPVSIAEFRSETLRLKGSTSTNRMVASLDSAHVLGGPSDPTQADAASRGASAYIDADRFGARSPTNGNGQDLALVSADVLKGGTGGNSDTIELLGTFDVVKQTASTLKWGFFFGDTGKDASGNRSHIHLGSWVAGDVLDASRLPTNGTASYAGNAIGNVINDGNNYLAVGTYDGSWNFGARLGTATLNFDGATQTGVVRQVGDSSGHFYGVLQGGGRVAEIKGAFIGGGASAGSIPNGQVGNFGISGTNYGAAGVFAAGKDCCR